MLDKHPDIESGACFRSIIIAEAKAVHQQKDDSSE